MKPRIMTMAKGTGLGAGMGALLLLCACEASAPGSLGANDPESGGTGACGPEGCPGPSGGSEAGGSGAESGEAGAPGAVGTGGAQNTGTGGQAPSGTGGAGATTEIRYGSVLTLTDEPIEEVTGIDFTVTSGSVPAEHHIAPASEESLWASGAFVSVTRGCGSGPPHAINVAGCQEGAFSCVDIALSSWGALLTYVDAAGVRVELPAVLEITVSPSEPWSKSPAPPRRARGTFRAAGGPNVDGLEGTFSLLVEDLVLLC